MTDNEIIKAIGYCTDESKFGCPDDCPFSEECDENVFSLDKAIVDLINRQKAENSELVGKIDKLQAEIERLQEELKITRACVHNNGLEWGLISIKKLVDDTKTEAIKEVEEKLKEWVEDPKNFNSNERTFILQGIENIFKKLVS